jgi:hypothetical protein
MTETETETGTDSGDQESKSKVKPNRESDDEADIYWLQDSTIKPGKASKQDKQNLKTIDLTKMQKKATGTKEKSWYAQSCVALYLFSPSRRVCGVW